MNKLSLQNNRFGRLTTGTETKYERLLTWWLCKCDCGNSIWVRGSYLKRGLTKSCGCLQKEMASKSNKTHAKTGSVEYASWQSAKGRCFNPLNHAYARYGGRGITMCERWKKSFANFFKDMGPRPPATSLDRIDNDGDYNPNNCRWATREEQAGNKRNSIIVPDGRCLRRFSIESGLSYKLIHKKLKKGMSLDGAISSAPMPRLY